MDAAEATAHEAIRADIEGNDVVLFMKGTAQMPQCGFSSRIAGVLNYMGVAYKDVNVLADPEIRQGIKDFSDWPTVPQLYVRGEFVGGCDIVTEMTISGELDALLDAHGIAYDRARALVGSDALVDLTVLAGHYTSVAMTLAAHRMPLPPGAEALLPSLRD